MKYSNFLWIFIVVLLLISCMKTVEMDPVSVTYELKNETNSKIKLSFNSIKHSLEDKIFNIDPDSTDVLFEKTVTFLGPSQSFTSEDYDTACVIFDDTLIIKYYRDSLTREHNFPNRNILLEENFIIIENKDTRFTYKYIIDNDDLNNATSID